MGGALCLGSMQQDKGNRCMVVFHFELINFLNFKIELNSNYF